MRSLFATALKESLRTAIVIAAKLQRNCSETAAIKVRSEAGRYAPSGCVTQRPNRNLARGGGKPCARLQERSRSLRFPWRSELSEDAAPSSSVPKRSIPPIRPRNAPWTPPLSPIRGTRTEPGSGSSTARRFSARLNQLVLQCGWQHTGASERARGFDSILISTGSKRTTTVTSPLNLDGRTQARTKRADGSEMPHPQQGCISLRATRLMPCPVSQGG